MNPQLSLQSIPQINKPFMLTSRHEEILQAVTFYRFVRVTDITRLLYSLTSSNHAGEQLQLLSGHHKAYPGLTFLHRFLLPHTRTGQAEFVYTLGRDGRTYQKRLGFTVDWYFRPAYSPSATSEQAGILSYSHLKHDLILTSLMVKAAVFARNSQRFSLHEQRIQYELRRYAYAAKLKTAKADETVEWVEPDFWLDFHQSRKPHLPILGEVDCATEQRKKFTRRVKGLGYFIQPNGPYKHLFATNAVRVAFFTTGSQVHLKNMLDWTQQALREEGLAKLTPKFLFCRLFPDWKNEDEIKLFHSPIWRSPGDKETVSLLP